MKYLQTFGFTVNNDVFKDNSWYFRNALVRANYKNLPKGIHSTSDYLELFFRNLILGEKNVLSNRSMLILESQSANNEISKCQNGSLDCSLDELAVLRFLKENPDAKQTDIAKHIGKSERTIKRITPSLIERGLLERENGKRNGRWVVKCDI
jgi:predicted HTH transcriptional regulator